MKRIILSLLLTLSLTLSLLPGGECGGHPRARKSCPARRGYGFTYAFVSPTTIEITAYYGYEAEVTVPSTIDGYTVRGPPNASTTRRATATPISLSARLSCPKR